MCKYIYESEYKELSEKQKSERFYWCNSHQRKAEECGHKGGILLPCKIVDLTDEIEIYIEKDDDGKLHL